MRVQLEGTFHILWNVVSALLPSPQLPNNNGFIACFFITAELGRKDKVPVLFLSANSLPLYLIAKC